MGCNCGKPKPGPNGGKQQEQDKQTSGGLSAQTQSFRLSTRPGQTFGSMLEAQAESVRTGGGVITPA